ncbi:MAG: FecR domain-containing protein [Rikenellaceae bacterium]
MNNINDIENDFLKIEEDLNQKWEEVLSGEDVCENTKESYNHVKQRITMFDKQSKYRNLKREIFRNIAVAATILIVITALFKYTLHVTSYKDVVGSILGKEETTVSLYAPNGKTVEVMLSDSTKVILNSGSVLIYPKVFNKSTRELNLIGEAYFSVHHNASSPFIVHTPYMNVRALGTVFTVKAYQKDATESATLLSGRIKVSPKDPKMLSEILNPDQQFTLSRSEGKGIVSEVNSKYEASWIDGKLIFDNCEFEDVINRLECQFGVVINYNSALYGAEKVVAKFIHNESLTEILNLLQGVCNFKYSSNGNRYVLYKLQSL